MFLSLVTLWQLQHITWRKRAMHKYLIIALLITMSPLYCAEKNRARAIAAARDLKAARHASQDESDEYLYTEPQPNEHQRFLEREKTAKKKFDRKLRAATALLNSVLYKNGSSQHFGSSPDTWPNIKDYESWALQELLNDPWLFNRKAMNYDAKWLPKRYLPKKPASPADDQRFCTWPTSSPSSPCANFEEEDRHPHNWGAVSPSSPYANLKVEDPLPYNWDAASPRSRTVSFFEECEAAIQKEKARERLAAERLYDWFLKLPELKKIINQKMAEELVAGWPFRPEHDISDLLTPPIVTRVEVTKEQFYLIREARAKMCPYDLNTCRLQELQDGERTLYFIVLR